jgi:hypothetical protein
MPPFGFDRAQAHYVSTSKSSTHESEEQIEGGKMGVDLVVAPKLWPTKPKITSGIGIFFGATNNFGKAEGATHVIALMLAKVIAFSSEISY